MEKGLRRVLVFLAEKNLKVGTLVTDQHKHINKWLREDHPGIKHYYDVAKGKLMQYIESMQVLI